MLSTKKFEEIRYVQWGLLTGEQIEALSVVKITKPSHKDGALDKRTDTPSDPRLGEQRNLVKCATCNKFNTECPGHMGSIKLPFPVYNLRYVATVLKLLQCICIHCARPRIKSSHIEILGYTKQKEITRLKSIADKCNKSVRVCPYEDCHEPMVFFSFSNKKKGDTGVLYYSVTSATINPIDGSTKKEVRREEFTAQEAYDVLSKISHEDLKLLGFNANLLNNDAYSDPSYFQNANMQHVHEVHPKAMIYTVLPVLSPSSRPYVEDDSGIKEDDLTTKTNELLKLIILYNTFNDVDVYGKKSSVTTRRGHVKTKADIAKDIMNNIWILCDNKEAAQNSVAALSITPVTKAHRSIVCRLTGKEGRIQQNVNGKRTDYSARAVIVGGGIRLKQDELGVPEEIAAKESIPEFVGQWNIEEMQSLVREGKVNYVKRMQQNKMGTVELNTITFTKFPDKGRSFVLRSGDEIGRHLRNGDIVAFNRQPTLSMPSILAFKVKIVQGLCFMLGLEWTPGFNAD